VGLEDQNALEKLRAVIAPESDSDEVIGQFYTRWFAMDMSARDLFPPDMEGQRNSFAYALSWVLGELAAQRAEEPVAFLAQLGRDHRKYGVSPEHYDSMREALFATMRGHLVDEWDDGLAATARDAVDFIAGVMRGAATAESAPPYTDGTVVEHIRATRDVSIIRLQLERPLAYHPGQYVSVEVPQWPRRWRYLSPSIPVDPTGAIEFHVRSVTGGMVSTAIVGDTKPGDRWRLSNPHGALEVDRNGGDVLMVAGSTGLAPLRALIMHMTQWGVNPRVHLFFGGRYPCDLYDLRTLWEIASSSPWLSVTPVSEFSTNPPWADEYPDAEPPRGLHLRQKGLLPDVVTRYGNWGDRQVLVCGGPQMVAATTAALVDRGLAPDAVQHDPVAG
jgi:NAD(P)H-flavin reductase/hemoglobin-like flavoprotein